MIVTYQIEIDKDKFQNFEEISQAAKETALAIGREIVSQTLKEWDDEISKARDKKRFRWKR